MEISSKAISNSAERLINADLMRDETSSLCVISSPASNWAYHRHIHIGLQQLVKTLEENENNPSICSMDGRDEGLSI